MKAVLDWIPGKTLGYITRHIGFRLGGWSVYVLAGENDDTGRRVAEDYDLKRIVRDHPELRNCRVVSAEDYFGIAVLRVRRAES